MTRPVLALVLVLALVPALVLGVLGAGCAPTPLDARRDASTESRAVVNGTDDDGDTAVMLLLAFDGITSVDACSGTRIAPRTVLTAAHCVTAFAGHDAFVLPGPAPTFDRSAGIEVLETIAHPSYGGGDTPGDAFDVGIFILAEDVPAPPVFLRRTPFTPDDGVDVVRAVGYGQTFFEEPFTTPQRRTVTSPLLVYNDFTVTTDERSGGICGGDSGGPRFIVVDGVEQIAAVTSIGHHGCDSAGTSVRVNHLIDFIDETVAAHLDVTCHGGDFCSPDCETLDPDCADGARCAGGGVCTHGCTDPDPDCRQDLGATCAFGEDCGADALCVAVDGASGTCLARCSKDGACENSATCATTPEGDAVCLP